MQLSITVQSEKLICPYKNLQNGIMLQDCELWMLRTEQCVTTQKFLPTLLCSALLYYILINLLAHSVYKMWIKQELNTLELWNKLHFEEEKKRRVYTMFKIFSTCICWMNI